MSEEAGGTKKSSSKDESRDEIIRKRSFSRARGIDISSFMVDDGSKEESAEIVDEVEVEQDILYEMRPHRVGTGPMRYKERDGVVPLSKVRCGDEVFPSGVNARRPGSVRGGGGE